MATIAKSCDNTSSDVSIWDCPVCLQIPKKEIYLCSNGHSICGSCLEKVNVCPVCRALFAGSETSRTRNFLAEELLNKMKFQCPWKDFGCQEVVPRDQFSNHEDTCKFGPIDVCQLCNLGEFCHTPLCAFLLSNSAAVNTVLSHMKNSHGFNVKTDHQFGSTNTLSVTSEYLNLVQYHQVNNRTLSFVEIKESSKLFARSELIMLICQFKSISVSSMEVSWAFVWLTEETADPNDTITVNCSVGGNKNSETVAVFGQSFAPQTSWSVAPMKVSEFKKYLKTPVNDRPQFPCSLSVSHILKYCVNKSVFTLFFNVCKEMCK